MYQKGKDNSAVDALSHFPKILDDEPAMVTSFTSMLMLDWADLVDMDQGYGPWITAIKSKLHNPNFDPYYRVKSGLLFYHNQMCLSPASNLHFRILDELHSSRIHYRIPDL